MTPAIAFDRVTIRFRAPSGAVHTVADAISLDIEEGTFVAIVGPSGCGKSTLLNCAAGLLFRPRAASASSARRCGARTAMRRTCSSRTPCCRGAACSTT